MSHALLLRVDLCAVPCKLDVSPLRIRFRAHKMNAPQYWTFRRYNEIRWGYKCALTLSVMWKTYRKSLNDRHNLTSCYMQRATDMAELADLKKAHKSFNFENCYSEVGNLKIWRQTANFLHSRYQIMPLNSTVLKSVSTDDVSLQSKDNRSTKHLSNSNRWYTKMENLPLVLRICLNSREVRTRKSICPPR